VSSISSLQLNEERTGLAEACNYVVNSHNHFDHIAAAKRSRSFVVDRRHTMVLTIAAAPCLRQGPIQWRAENGAQLTLPRSIILTDRVEQLLSATWMIGKTWKTGSTEHKRDPKWQASTKACISARYIRMYISID
jgi:hypothetical protein